ncbi:MAG: LegC family aminotransferase [Candidatus Marinimicrobia bacterium]|nr:LegC family aminotransferase [Candidatus Neomarinimicrobiota bacterium]
MFEKVVRFIKKIYGNKEQVILHEPVFLGNEKKYINDCIDSTFVSYVGKYVTQFEEMTAEYTGAKYAVAVVNGTTALQVALQLAGVKPGDEVITQPLTFVATANAISHCGANPVFIDVDLDTMGMSPEKLDDWLSKNSKYDPDTNQQINKSTNQPISAIVPMHTFGFPCRIDEIVEIADKYHIPVIEDAAESLGSLYKNKHTGTFGLAGIISYNGNKTITTGGGGVIITDDEAFAEKAKHITTTAKVPHKWEYIHDEIGYNYRMTNVTAAIGVAQMENIEMIIENKRQTAKLYKSFFSALEQSDNEIIKFVNEPKNSRSNFWLNCVQLKDKKERDKFLEETNSNGVMTRPIWRLMNKLEMYKDCQKGNLDNSEWFEDRIVNIPSGYRNEKK